MNKEYHGIHTNNDFRDCFLKLASGQKIKNLKIHGIQPTYTITHSQ